MTPLDVAAASIERCSAPTLLRVAVDVLASAVRVGLVDPHAGHGGEPAPATVSDLLDAQVEARHVSCVLAAVNEAALGFLHAPAERVARATPGFTEDFAATLREEVGDRFDVDDEISWWVRRRLLKVSWKASAALGRMPAKVLRDATTTHG